MYKKIIMLISCTQLQIKQEIFTIIIMHVRIMYTKKESKPLKIVMQAKHTSSNLCICLIKKSP